MFYYQHHIGDHARIASHLTLLEEGVLLRLRDKYISTEGPLPANVEAVQRLVGARTEDERSAVQTILEEFFALTDDGWSCKMLEDVIAGFRAKSEKARDAANTRWNRKTEAGSEDSVTAMRSHCGGIANQKPLTKEPKSQKPSITHTQPSAETVRDGLNADNAFREFWNVCPRKKSENYEMTKQLFGDIVTEGQADAALLVRKMGAYAHSMVGHDPLYIKTPHHWLNDAYWED